MCTCERVWMRVHGGLYVCVCARALVCDQHVVHDGRDAAHLPSVSLVKEPAGHGVQEELDTRPSPTPQGVTCKGRVGDRNRW